MKPSTMFDAIVATIAALVPDSQANKTDVFVYDPSAIDELKGKDRRFALIPLSLPDRVTERGSCTEERISFEIVVRYSHTGGVESWHRILDDSKQIMDAITGMHTGIANVTRVFEDSSDVQFARREMTSTRAFTVTYRGD